MRRLVRRDRREDHVELLSPVSSYQYHSSPLSAVPQISRPPSNTSSLHLPFNLKPSQPVSYLLRLPLELRISIFRYLIPTPENSSFNIYTSRDTPSSGYHNLFDNCNQNQGPPLFQHPSLHPHPHCRWPYYAKTSDNLAILRTSHQLHSEALSILYGENKFNFLSSSPNFLSVLDWVRRLSPEAKRQMRQVKVNLMPFVREEQIRAFEALMLEWLPGLVVLDSGGGIVRGDSR